MNEELQAQLIKQLKVLNFWIRLFGTVMVVTAIIVVYLLVRVVLFVRHTNQTIQNLQQQTTGKLDIKSQVCNGSGTFTDLIKNKTSACQ